MNENNVVGTDLKIIFLADQTAVYQCSTYNNIVLYFVFEQIGIHFIITIFILFESWTAAIDIPYEDLNNPYK